MTEQSQALHSGGSVIFRARVRIPFWYLLVNFVEVTVTEDISDIINV